MSFVTHSNACTALCGSVMSGVSRWGTRCAPAYAENSMRVVSINRMRTWSGVARMRIVASIAWMKLDLPVSFMPPMSIWGIAVISAVTMRPPQSLPIGTRVGVASSAISCEHNTSPRCTISGVAFGISMEIALFPGIGEYMRTLEVAAV